VEKKKVERHVCLKVSKTNKNEGLTIYSLGQLCQDSAEAYAHEDSYRRACCNDRECYRAQPSSADWECVGKNTELEAI